MVKDPKHLKIALVLDDSLDKADGVQQYVLAVGKHLSSLGHEVHYLVGQTKRTDIPHIHSLSRNVNVRFNHNRMSMPLPAKRRRITEVLRREDFDIIHVQMPYSPFLAGRIIKAAGPRTKIVGTFHVAPHSDTVFWANRILALAVGRSLKKFSKIICVSEIARDFAASTFGIKDAVVIPNTVDLSPYFLAKAFPDYANVPVVSFLGRLVERKGCQNLLAAVALLKKHNKLPSGCKILICGKGPLEQQLRAYVHNAGLQEYVEFKGFVTEVEKSRYLASSNAVVFPSTGGESFGIVLIEAMAALPGVVLAGNNPGYAEVMRDMPDQIFDTAKHLELAKKLSVYLNNYALRRKASAHQKHFVRQFHTTEVVAQILDVYNSAIAQN